MAVAYQSVSTGAGGTLAKPSGLAVGDIMIGILSTATFGTGGAVSAASGFATVASQTVTSNGYLDMYVFSKRATPDDVAASTFNFGGGKGALYRLSDAAGNSGEIVGKITEGADLSDTIPTIAENVIIFFQGNSNNASQSDTLTSVTLTGGTNPTWTIDYNGTQAGHSVGVAHGSYPSTTTITELTGDLSQSDDDIKGYVLLRSTAGAAGTNTLLAVSPSYFSQAGRGDTNASADFIEVQPYLPTQSGRGETPTVWTPEVKPLATWVDKQK